MSDEAAQAEGMEEVHWQEKLRRMGFTVFEGIKVGMSQDKNGLKLTFRVHEEDFASAEPVVNSRLGTRLAMAFVQVNEDETTRALKTEAGPDTEDGERAVRMAGMLCRELTFREWLMNAHQVGDPIGNDVCTEEEAATWLCAQCGIQSRRELANRPTARQKLYDIKEQFKMARAKGII